MTLNDSSISYSCNSIGIMNQQQQQPTTTASNCTNDAYNTNDDDELWRLVDEAIDYGIPYIEKTGYLEAKLKAPLLVREETQVRWFLVYEQWNLFAAAQRIVKYWEWKRTLFGEHRTFLPIIDLSGETGAIDTVDLQYIRCGVIALLPSSSANDCFHVFFNLYRAPDGIPWYDIPQIIRSRMQFYFLYYLIYTYYHKHPVPPQQPSVHPAYDNTSSTGTADVSDVETTTTTTTPTPTNTPTFLILGVLHSFVTRLTSNFPDLVTDAMPIKLLRCYVLFSPPASFVSSLAVFDNTIIATIAKTIIQNYVPSTPTFLNFLKLQTICCFQATDLASKLVNSSNNQQQQQQCFRFNMKDLPLEIGGSWSYDTFNEWVEATHQEYVQRNQQHLLLLQQQQLQQQIQLASNDSNNDTTNTNYVPVDPSLTDLTNNCNDNNNDSFYYNIAGIMPNPQHTNNSILPTTTYPHDHAYAIHNHNNMSNDCLYPSGSGITAMDTTSNTVLPNCMESNRNNHYFNTATNVISTAVPTTTTTSSFGNQAVVGVSKVVHSVDASSYGVSSSFQQHAKCGPVSATTTATASSSISSTSSCIDNKCINIVAPLSSMLPETSFPELVILRQNKGSADFSPMSPYSRMREKLFGRDQYQLPMNQIGTGVLSLDDIAMLNTGFLMILPKNIAKQCVLSYEPSKVTVTGSTMQQSFQHQRRCFFYYLDLITRMYSTQFDSNNHDGNSDDNTTDPISLEILAFICQDVAATSLDETVMGETFSDILRAFPKINVVRIHIFLEPVQLGWYLYQTNAEWKALLLFEGDDPTKHDDDKNTDDGNHKMNIECHTLQTDEVSSTTTTTDDIDKEPYFADYFSTSYRYQKKYLPESMGGGWTYHSFRLWQQEIISWQQQQQEQQDGGEGH